MNDGRRARAAAFNVYAANLSAYRPEFKDTFLCPFCHQPFGREALEDPPKLALAHCTPKASGGRLSALACAACDNSAGADVDHHLKHRVETEEFWFGLSPGGMRCQQVVGDQRVSVDFHPVRNESGKNLFEIRVVEKTSSKEALKAVKEAFEAEAANPQGMEFKLRGPFLSHERLYRIAMVRSAFLMMFRHFGYSYILHPNIEHVRQQLLRPREPIIPSLPCVILPEGLMASDTVAVVNSPCELRSFLVPMRFKTDGNRTVWKGAFMPGLSPDSERVYEALAKHEEQNDSFRLRFRVFPFERGRLSRPEAVSIPFVAWERATSESGSGGACDSDPATPQ